MSEIYEHELAVHTTQLAKPTRKKKRIRKQVSRHLEQNQPAIHAYVVTDPRRRMLDTANPHGARISDSKYKVDYNKSK